MHKTQPPCRVEDAEVPNLVVSEITERERLAQAHLEKERARMRERSSRKREVGPRSFVRYSKRELERAKLENSDLDHIQRPKTRGECADVERPCPFVSCRYHLYLDASSKNGSIRMNFPDLEVDELEESCVLDVADRNGETVEGIATMMNLTRERIRQLEVGAFEKLKTLGAIDEVRALVDEAPVGKRRLHVIQPSEEYFAGEDDDGQEEEETVEAESAVQNSNASPSAYELLPT